MNTKHETFPLPPAHMESLRKLKACSISVFRYFIMQSSMGTSRHFFTCWAAKIYIEEHHAEEEVEKLPCLCGIKEHLEQYNNEKNIWKPGFLHTNHCAFYVFAVLIVGFCGMFGHLVLIVIAATSNEMSAEWVVICWGRISAFYWFISFYNFVYCIPNVLLLWSFNPPLDKMKKNVFDFYNTLNILWWCSFLYS